jgi:Ser/Thr protein kinase RdoA (MazF antagonist)
MLPTSDEWLRVRVRDVVELHAGMQSRVFAATVDGVKSAVKLTDRRLADQAALTARMLVMEALADDIELVVAPMRIDGELVGTIGGWLITATAFVEGERLDITNTADAHRMGRTLARLHAALARVPDAGLPPVAALDSSGGVAGRRDWQLLHGDFNDQNAVVTPAGLRIFDFDDCGYGPVEFDIANSLYMVLFDSDVNLRPERYEAFRPAFLEGYAHTAGGAVDDEVVDSLISTRISALGRWLDDLASAPIGIRTSSPAWRRTLRTFVAAHARPDDG